MLFEKPYRRRTIVAGVMNICISFEYRHRLFLPSILARFLGAGVFETISRLAGAECAVCLYRRPAGDASGVEIPVAPRGDCRLRAAVYRPDRPCAGRPAAGLGVVLAIAMLGLWLFAEGFGPGAQLMIYPALSILPRFAPPASASAGRSPVSAARWRCSSAAAAGLPRHSRCSGWCRWPPLFRFSSCLRSATSRRVTILTTATIKEQMMTLLYRYRL